MSDNAPDSPAGHARRLTSVEELHTHFERTLADLNSVILEQQARLSALEQRLAMLTDEVNSVAAQAETPRRLEDDKPPHY